jgi:hypothetical protein
MWAFLFCDMPAGPLLAALVLNRATGDAWVLGQGGPAVVPRLIGVGSPGPRATMVVGGMEQSP